MSNTAVVGREQCPRCLDSKQDNLILYSDGGKHCHACGHHVRGNSNYINPDNIAGANQQMNIDLTPILKKRNISEEVYKRYGVKAFYNESTTVASIGFPLVDANGIVSSYHFRKLDLQEGKITREFYYEKGKKVKVPLFGWNLVNSKTKKIVICEGETDALALASTNTFSSDTVILGTVGTGFATKVSSWLTLKCAKHEIILAFDNDRAGREATDKIVMALNERGIKPQRLKFEADDVSAAIEAGEDLSEIVTASACIFKSGGSVADSWLEDERQLYNGDVFFPEFSPTLKKSLPFYPGHLVVIFGDSGSGKSTLTYQLALDCLKPKLDVAMISAEMKTSEIATALLSVMEAKNYAARDFNNPPTREEMMETHKKMTKLCERFHITDNFGSVNFDTIEKNILELTAMGNHPKIVIIDHFLAVAESTDLHQTEQTTKRLKEIARRCNTCVIIICHIRKPPSTSAHYHPTLSDIYMTGSLGRFADAALAVSSNKELAETYITSAKIPRLGGSFFKATFKYVNCQLHEVEEKTQGKANTFDIEDTDEYEAY